MAAIIDGTTYKGFWKITADSGIADVWYLVPKYDLVNFAQDASNGRFKIESDPAGNSFQIAYDITCEDGDGNVLATPAAVSLYISQNR